MRKLISGCCLLIIALGGWQIHRAVQQQREWQLSDHDLVFANDSILSKGPWFIRDARGITVKREYWMLPQESSCSLSDYAIDKCGEIRELRDTPSDFYISH